MKKIDVKVYYYRFLEFKDEREDFKSFRREKLEICIRIVGFSGIRLFSKNFWN